MSNEAPDLLVEITTRRQVYLERYKAGEFKKYDPFLKRIAKLIKSRLNSGDYGEWTRTELNKQLRSVNRDIKLIQGEYIQDFEKSSLELAQYEAGFEARSLEQAVKYDFDLPTETQLKSAVMTNPLQAKGANGKLLMPFVKDMASNQINNITNAIRAGVYQGLTTDQIVKNIIGTKVSPGEINKLYKDTRLTVHTGLQHVSVQAREETWKRNKSVVKEVQWSSTLDEKTSTICRTLDHQKFPVDEGPRPPAHFGCRSSIVAALPERWEFLREGATRSGRDEFGKVTSYPADMSYYDWLKKQSPGFQDSAIGKTKGKLLRDGGLTSEQFAKLQLNKKFEPITLDEMRELEPLAFAKMEHKERIRDAAAKK